MTYISSSRSAHVDLTISVDGVTQRGPSYTFLDSKDVFHQRGVARMREEMTFIKKFTELHHPGEYSGMYCMQAAERGLSELQGNDTDLYAVDRSHNRKNRISLAGKTAIDRGAELGAAGLTLDPYVFDGFGVDQSKLREIYDSKDEAEADANWKSVMYDIVQFQKGRESEVERYLEGGLRRKEIGYHIYYVSVTEGFHTLVLIVDLWTDPCKPTFQIWDQHGETSSAGPLSELAEGIRRQTSWTFANSCFNRFKNGRTKRGDRLLWDKTTAHLRKVVRK